MFKSIVNLFFPKTLDAAISQFAKAEQALTDVVVVRESDAAELSLKINELQIEHGCILMEIAHAKRIQEKLRNLLD